MREIFKNKSFIIFAVAVIILIIASVLLIIFKDKEEPIVDEEGKVINVETSDVESIYNVLSNVDCNNNLVWDFDNSDIIYSKDIDESLKIKLVLSYLDSKELLNEKLTIDVFNDSSIKMFGKELGSKLVFKETTYNNKTYNISDTQTIINSLGECTESNYVSKLYGYTYNENELSVDIAIALKEDNKLNDLNNEELGVFNISNSTKYRYSYKLENNNYYLNNITKVITVKGPIE